MAKPKGNPGQLGLHKALTHPLRTEILLAMQAEGPCSPNGFRESTKGTESEVGLNIVAYHFQVLLGVEAIELVDTIPRRGATEHVYRINPNSQVLDLMRATDLLQRVAAGTDTTLDEALIGCDEQAVAILPVELDQPGQRELQQILAALKTGLAELAECCRRRLSKSTESPIVMRVGIATYSPDPNGASLRSPAKARTTRKDACGEAGKGR